MAANSQYDNERIVRQTEVHDAPTEQLPSTHVVHETTAVGHDHVVREEIVRRPVVQHGVDEVVTEGIDLDHVVARRSTLDRISSVIWFAAGLLEIALGLRIVFRLLEANQANGFVTFVNNVTEPFVRPFQGIFTDPASNGAVLDSAALMAMVIWLVGRYR